MNQTFLATSGLIAVANRRDQWHEHAEVTWKHFLAEQRRLVTTNIVLIELGDGLWRLNERSIAVSIREMLVRSADIVNLTPAIEDAAWTLFADRADKEWGLTDCISMTVMEQRGIRDVFTLDHHFRQAGFQTFP